MRTILILGAATLLAGCASVGRPIDPSTLASLEKGVTSYGTVTKKLGPPTVVTTMSDGRRMVMYTYAYSSVEPENFIPIIGPLLGGVNSHGTAVQLTFDKNDILEGLTQSETQVGTNRGLSSQ